MASESPTALEDVIQTLIATGDCHFLPSASAPSVPTGLTMPKDLTHFYLLYGGALLFPDEDFGFQIVAPADLAHANTTIIGQSFSDDISDEWYIFARSGREQYVTIDLNPSRAGRCYDSFWDVHGVVGSCSVVALSFTAFLRGVLSSRGKKLYWLGHDFATLGDAYDQ